MSLIGSADFDRPITFASGRIFYPFGGGPFQLEPFRCGVTTANTGLVEFQLDLIRALSDRDSRATLSCTIAAEYATEEALATVREINPTASLASSVLTDWWFRLLPTPALSGQAELMAPVLLASNGLGTARLMMSLSIESGLILEAILKEYGSLDAIAEAQITGVSPRLPVVVRFDSSAVLSELLERADRTGALPRRIIVEYFSGDTSKLPLHISGSFDATSNSRFADAMTDRIIERFGRYIPSQEIDDAPVVQLDQSGANSSILWSLSQPFIANRRIVVPVDLLSAAQKQIDRLGASSVIQRRDLTALPPLGQSRVTLLCNLPASRAGVDALGVTLMFPPRSPDRPQLQTATALFESTDDIAKVDVRLSPGEPLRYRYSTFAVVSDENGTRQIDMPEADGEGPLLRLSPEHFPIEFALIEVTSALGQLAVISGICAYEQDGQMHERPFRIDSGQLSIGIPIPRERTSIRIDVIAIARDGSGELRLGPFETPQVRLDVTSFATYGPQQVDVRCVFDDSATLRAVSLLPKGSAESDENITTLTLTPAESLRTFRWFARSPFGIGFRYRPYHAQGGVWTDAPLGAPALVLFSSRLRRQEAMKEVSARSDRGVREVMPRRPGRQMETEAVVAEAAVVAIGTSPSPEPSDELLYTSVEDATKNLFVPRYVLDVQTVSGQSRYRIRMAQQGETSTLEINLVAVPAPSLAERARDAAEYRHLLTIHLDFLVAPSAGARKTLEFTDVTRNGAVVTARLTFATLAERDDVYRALTEPERGARLIVRRFIDVSVPQRAPQPNGGRPHFKLPHRPIVEWPPPQLAALPPRHIPDPAISILASPGPVIKTGGIKTARLRRESAPARSLEAGGLSARLVNRFDAIDVLTTVATLPVDRFVNALPTPQLSFTGSEQEGQMIRYKLSIDNWSEFSDEFFAASPDLPPCGRNTSASRTWVNIQDVDTGDRLYGFCALRSAKELAELSFYLPQGTRVPNVSVFMDDRRARFLRFSNTVATTAPQPSVPPYLSIRAELEQIVEPAPFAFPPALHGYIFQGVTPTSGSNQLVRYRFSWDGTFHTYLQDASRPSDVYVFADQFKIARRRDAPPFTPFVTVRVSSRDDGSATNVVVDYVVAPYIDLKRLNNAREQLLANPQFGATRVDFQPLLTSDVRFMIDRPTKSGAVREQRSGVAVVLQGALKDTLSMPLDDFGVLFDAMYRRTASLFVGSVEIDVPNEATEVIPFSARMDDLEGEMFSYEAVSQPDGTVLVTLTNDIESPVDIQTLDATISRDGQQVRGLVQGTAVPREQLLPGQTMQLTLAPETALTSTSQPQVTFDLSGVKVTPNPEAIWNSILERRTVEYFKIVTVKAIPTLFEAVPGREEEKILSILVEFEGGGTAELRASALQAQVRIDLPLDDVILGRVTTPKYRYIVEVIRANGRQDRDTQPNEKTADTFFVNVIR